MRAAFRVDASLVTGSGHVMRCLTLADALRAGGADCHFLCREHPGHLIDVIRGRGHDCTPLPPGPSATTAGSGRPYGDWLGTTQEEDARQCRPLLEALRPDWLIVDHYALDAGWESALRPTCRGLLAIDDLGDRPHACNVLLDQNLGHSPALYAGLVPPHCELLLGTRHALLRPEFAARREASLARRDTPRLQHVVVSLGGVDNDNATGTVLASLASAALPAACRLTVVMGRHAPWLDAVRAQAARLPLPVEVRVDVDDMADLLASCDLAIGASGGSAWERCCLGVPALLIVLADNQASIARALADAGAGLLVGGPADIASALPGALATARDAGWLAGASRRARDLCDGRGAERVATTLRRLHA